MFAPLTKVKSAHHQATGFVQASELGRARHCELMVQFPHATKLTSNRINSVTLRFISRPKNCDGGGSRASTADQTDISKLNGWRLILESGQRTGLGRSLGFVPRRGRRTS